MCRGIRPMSANDNIAQAEVCMVSGSYPPMEDGVAGYTQRLFSTVKQEFKSILLVTTGNNGLERDREDGVLDVVEKWSFRALPSIVRHIKTTESSIVHIQYPAHGYGTNPAANFLPMLLRIISPRTRLISTIHEFSNHTLKGKSRLLINIVPSHKIIIVDQQYRRDIKRFWPFAGGKFVHIPVGSNIPLRLEPDESELRRLRSSAGIGENVPVISCFGAVRPGKGIEFLLRAFHELLQKHPEARLLFIGRIYENYYEQSIRGMIEDRQLSSNVTFTGPCEQDEISQYFALASMCVLPFEDGVSTKRTSFMAALQHGLPTITTRSDFLPDGLVDYENVILVKYGDEKALVGKMVELIENEELRNRLRSHAREVLKNYSWDSIAEKTIEVYRSLAR